MCRVLCDASERPTKWVKPGQVARCLSPRMSSNKKLIYLSDIHGNARVAKAACEDGES